MTATKPTEATEQPDLIEELTDDAITNERNKLRRMIATRSKQQFEIEKEIKQLEARDELLIAAQIDRLKKQSRASAAPQDAQQGGGE